MLQACFGIAGGCGCSLLGTCGALNAAAWAISLCYGRPINDLGGDYEKCHAMIRELVEDFRKEYDGILCSEVMIHNMGAVYDWKTPEGDPGLHGSQRHFPLCDSSCILCRKDWPYDCRRKVKEKLTERNKSYSTKNPAASDL